MARMVKLLDGTEVPSDSEAWRHECEARHVCNMKTKRQRHEYLFGTLDQCGKERGGVRGKRGEEALKRLQETILQIWNAPKGANDNQQK